MRFISTLRAAWHLRQANRALEEANALQAAADACRARAERRMAQAGRLLARAPRPASPPLMAALAHLWVRRAA
ncbi:hypothetical protein [Methylobacterium nodulans]|uniref:Uncharacterized protein n=1 Tax=Methylobacterium nodulans (strain LMG 21967 / CNCM I-2342 / ORS 2060) TaxID=460265 RepID=B8ITX9_METNO|nr:hypothetical protein [Methylobacterium nodulans]ACL60837.1 hypothetical protein Mnod_6010 [Methylobacterium nodulans ORS 2060]